MNFAVALRLGRVSNLPTVWTNALAGLVLAGGWLDPAPLLLLFLAVSLAYVGGMFLNDAFDAEVDAVRRPERPIPSGAANIPLGTALRPPPRGACFHGSRNRRGSRMRNSGKPSSWPLGMNRSGIDVCSPLPTTPPSGVKNCAR